MKATKCWGKMLLVGMLGMVLALGMVSCSDGNVGSADIQGTWVKGTGTDQVKLYFSAHNLRLRDYKDSDEFSGTYSYNGFSVTFYGQQYPATLSNGNTTLTISGLSTVQGVNLSPWNGTYTKE
jgi:hypothetical protein